MRKEKQHLISKKHNQKSLSKKNYNRISQSYTEDYKLYKIEQFHDALFYIGIIILAIAIAIICTLGCSVISNKINNNRNSQWQNQCN